MGKNTPLLPQELAALVLKAQDGDTEAFGKIYDEFLTPVYRYVVFRFPADLTEDLVADIFVKAFEKLHSYRPIFGVPFSAWLFRIARHTIIDAYRRNRGFEELSEEFVDESRESDPKLRTEQSLSVRRVREAIMKLPEDHRDVVLLHYISGLGHREVAKALHMTEGYVRILKFRALKKLEGLLSLSILPND
ncbi:RNA polymerase sigma factor [Candidatus Peribacteria bacterium]|nr:RNA polymerase sigma factor [Candidatus Peribacteria bacterium]